MREFIHQQRADTARRRNKLPPIGKLDRKTVVSIRKRLGAKRRHAQDMNDVKVSAASDVRKAFTLYVMLLAYTKLLWDCMVFNWDATTFEIGLLMIKMTTRLLQLREILSFRLELNGFHLFQLMV